MIDTYPEVIEGYEACMWGRCRDENPYQENHLLSLHYLWNAGWCIAWAEKLKEDGR